MISSDKLVAMQELYMETERQMNQLLSIIPYQHNPDTVYSPQLVSILQSIGSQVDAMLKLVSQDLGLKVHPRKFPFYYAELNKEGMLSVQKVMLRKKKRILKPFNYKQPKWWDAYNCTKHDLPEGMFEAKLGRVMSAFAALFVLHCIALIPTVNLEPRSIIAQNPELAAPKMIMGRKNWYAIDREYKKSASTQSIHFTYSEGRAGSALPSSIANMTHVKVQPFKFWQSELFLNMSMYKPVLGDIRITP